MNKIVKLTVVLFLVCAIVAGVLGGVNLITKDKIAEQDRMPRPTPQSLKHPITRTSITIRPPS